VRKVDNLPPSCAVVTKSGNLNFLEPSGPVQACNGTALPFHVNKKYSREITQNESSTPLIPSSDWTRSNSCYSDLPSLKPPNSVLISSFHFHLGLLSGLDFKTFPTKILNVIPCSSSSDLKSLLRETCRFTTQSL